MQKIEINFQHVMNTLLARSSVCFFALKKCLFFLDIWLKIILPLEPTSPNQGLYHIRLMPPEIELLYTVIYCWLLCTLFFSSNRFLFPLTKSRLINFGTV